MLILWQFEGCEHSQPVRAKLTALALDFVAINAPPGHADRDAVMEKLFGNDKTPSLWDTRTSVLLQGEDAICDYLEEHYRDK